MFEIMVLALLGVIAGLLAAIWRGQVEFRARWEIGDVSRRTNDDVASSQLMNINENLQLIRENLDDES